MSKKKAKHKSSPHHSKKPLKSNSTLKRSTPTNPTSRPRSSKPESTKQHTQPTIPFRSDDKILILGDGDLSFANSLSTTHICTSLTATVFDSESVTYGKYPQAAAHATSIRDAEGMVLFNIDATKLHTYRHLKNKIFDRILFNFPHVGGKSTDVNRQVRYNQELLVGMFQSVSRVLDPVEGTIVVTLFEGEPYTLWNIRDLARHSGLAVRTSFVFRHEAYPGYAHVRTLGNIEGGGGWKGEDRAARSFVFEVKKDAPVGEIKKRKRGQASDDDDDDDDG